MKSWNDDGPVPLDVCLPEDPTEDEAEQFWNGLSDTARAVWMERFEGDGTRSGNANIVRNAVARFLAKGQDRVEQTKITAGRFHVMRRKTNHFAEFLRLNTSITQINGSTLEQYSSHLAKEQRINGWSTPYTQAHFDGAKQFIRWAYEVELIDRLPRNLNNHDLNFKIDAEEVPVFSVDEIKALLELLPEQMRLFALIAQYRIYAEGHCRFGTQAS